MASFCTNCAAPLESGTKFCSNCGTTVEVLTSPRAASQPSRPGPPATAARVPASTSRSAPAIAVAPARPGAFAVAGEIPRPVPVAAPAAPAIVSEVEGLEKSAAPSAVSKVPPWVLAALAIAVALAAFLSYRFFASRSPSVSDAEIIHSIQTRFAADPNLRDCTVEVKSQNGVVTLIGLVNQEPDKTTAANIAARQPGVKQVNAYGLVVSNSGSNEEPSQEEPPPDPSSRSAANDPAPRPNPKTVADALVAAVDQARKEAVAQQQEQSTPVFASILALGKRSFASGFSATGDFTFADDRIFLQSGATASFSFSVPQGQTRTVVYGIPAGGFVNNAPFEIWVNDGEVTKIAESTGGLGATTPSTLRLWRKTFGPGNYILTLKSLGRSVNVYGFWLSPSPSFSRDTSPPNLTPETVVVQGNQRWSATNTTLQAGDVVTISATGAVFMGQGWPPMPPAGRPPNCQRRGGFTAGELPCWSLIGRIGEQGTPFYVGNRITLRAPASGPLFLGVNDDQLGDNSGSWTATIAAQNSSAASASSSPDNTAVSVRAIVRPNQTSVRLPPGNFYLFCMATGGALPSKPFESGGYAQVTDRAGYLAAALAYGTSDHNEFQTSTWNHVVGGASISGYWDSYKAFYGSNPQPGASNASVTFTVDENSLVVVIGLAGGQTNLSVQGLPELQIDASSSIADGVVPMVIAHTYLQPGHYTATEVSSDTAKQDSTSMADLIGVFAFGSRR